MQGFNVRKLARLGIGALAFLIFAPLHSAFGLTQSDIVSGGSVWLETTLVVAMVFITAMAFSLQIARGYFIRTLNKFSLRLGADIWWLAYVLIRDGLIFIAFIMGLLVFFPGTILDYPMAVPFMPLAVVLFGIALVTKLYFDADDNRNAFRFVTVTLFIGTAMWIFGTIFVTESPLQLNPLPAGIASNSFLSYLFQNFNSQNNPTMALYSIQACFAALGVLGLIGFAHPILHSRLAKTRKTVTVSSPQTVTSPFVKVSKKETATQAPGSPSIQSRTSSEEA
jgi:hypothetical protein